MSALTGLMAVDPPEYPNLEWLVPALGIGGSIVVALIGAASLIWRRRQDRKDTLDDKLTDKAPDVTDGWAEVRQARAEASRYYRLFRVFEELYYSVASALRFLSRKWHERLPEEPLDPEVVKALELRPPEDLDKA